MTQNLSARVRNAEMITKRAFTKFDAELASLTFPIKHNNASAGSLIVALMAEQARPRAKAAAACAELKRTIEKTISGLEADMVRDAAILRAVADFITGKRSTLHSETETSIADGARLIRADGDVTSARTTADALEEAATRIEKEHERLKAAWLPRTELAMKAAIAKRLSAVHEKCGDELRAKANYTLYRKITSRLRTHMRVMAKSTRGF